jgi:L-alanine-DL-glutamate epimerase-like enolase superfamily enzyme
MRPFIRESPITKEGYGFQVENSHMPVPEEPGLGITLDDEICEKYRIG